MSTNNTMNSPTPSLVVHSDSESKTVEIGKAIGNSMTAGSLIGLNGTLGAGKTRLTQGIGESLGIVHGQIVSPTFTICVPHEGRIPFLHLDAYRIRTPEEVDELGLDEMLENGVSLIVEWVDLIKTLLPDVDLEIQIEAPTHDSRDFLFFANTDNGKQMLDALETKNLDQS
ncbi:tRNA (adenosine(37)-N6)-threonylcarbamoyltransferase complex ATPase subunit type 1 TsaE [Mariniblastus sp.]|mgnify:CR=1 FL=1|nr:tRNA (adenosine(37)-N6)-threonylcarbamoyltransferase complex ATPase subunit type 1 TsaE [Mariniblastus sp.]MDB4545332.1 tRNA (adenosine(37)-N6)-threonylcarbamoyltransferase complex ATPase subunit type 1 TsaE [bacterium]